MRFSSAIVLLGATVIAATSPLVRQNKPVDVVISTLNTVGEHLSIYKAAVDAFPSSASNAEKVNAVAKINQAAASVAADFEQTNTPLWAVLNDDTIIWTAEEQQKLADLLSSKIQEIFIGGFSKAAELQPQVRALGCATQKGVYNSMLGLYQNFMNAVNYVATYKSGSYFNPISKVYSAMTTPLGNSVQKYQPLPTDGC